MACPSNALFRYSAHDLLGGTIRSTGGTNCAFTFNTRRRFCLFGLSRANDSAGVPCSRTKCVSVTPRSHNRGVHHRVYLALRRVNVHPRDSRRRRNPKRGRVSFHCSSPLATTSGAVAFRAIIGAVTHHGNIFISFDPGPLSSGPNGNFRVGVSIGPDSDSRGLYCVVTNILRGIIRVATFLGPARRSCGHFKVSGTPNCIS